jgi:predicted RNA-binding Zn-ribbon protein involved in translation (DUF1610 family)
VTTTPFPCSNCGGTVAFQRCDDERDTGHPWLVAMQCQDCGDYYEAMCPQCERNARPMPAKEPRQLARCDWCKQMVPVASRAEADHWLITHDCPDADAKRQEASP